jgi:hypothetical protein
MALKRFRLLVLVIVISTAVFSKPERPSTHSETYSRIFSPQVRSGIGALAASYMLLGFLPSLSRNGITDWNKWVRLGFGAGATYLFYNYFLKIEKLFRSS